MEDLGRMHPTEMYARSLAVGPNGKVYVGIGTAKGDLVVFDPATRQHHSILPPGLRGTPGWSAVNVSRRSDGKVYAAYGTNLLCGWTTRRRCACPPHPRRRRSSCAMAASLLHSTAAAFSLRDPRHRQDGRAHLRVSGERGQDLRRWGGSQPLRLWQHGHAAGSLSL